MTTHFPNTATSYVKTLQKKSKPRQIPATLPAIKDLSFNPQTHRYSYRGETLPISVTSILSHDMLDSVRQRIEETKHLWEPRGNHLHNLVECHLNGEAELNWGDYSEWAEPLLSHPIFNRYKAIATEYRLVDKRRRYAGSLDFLLAGETPSGEPKVLLGDLKSKQRLNSAVGDHRAQLGAYYSMLIQHHPYLIVDQCIVVNSFPGKVEISVYEPQQCLEAWDDRYQAFCEWKPSF